MRVAVTGAAGQLGSLVLKRLLADRTVTEVRALDLRPPSVVGRNLLYQRADVRDPEFGRFVEGCDALIHLAFMVSVEAPRALFDAVNVEGSKNVFRAAAAAGVKTIVYSSSVAAYGVAPGHPVPLLEDAPRRYVEHFAYSANKFQVEAFLDEFEPAHPEIAIARLRPTILLGRYMEHLFGDGIRRRTLSASPNAGPFIIVWDEDVADAAILALTRRARGAFNLSADEPLPPLELARAAGIRAIALPPLVVRSLPYVLPALGRLGLTHSVDPAWLRTQRSVMLPSSEKAKRELGWRPRCPTAVSVLERCLQTLPERLHPRLDAFFRLLGLAAPRLPPLAGAENLSLTLHLNLTGRQGGDLGLILVDGRLRVQRGVPRPLQAVVTLSDEDCLLLLTGELDGSAAQLAGRLRVEGDPTAGMVLLGLVALFRGAVEAPGAPGWMAQRFSAWLSQGAPRPLRH